MKYAVSYIPLCGLDFVSDGIIDEYSDTGDGYFEPDGVGWFVNKNGELMVGFAFKDKLCYDLYKHFEFWCDGNSSFMHLEFEVYEDYFIVKLIPNDREYYEIFKDIRLEGMRYEDIFFVYRPIDCVSDDIEGFMKYKDLIGDEVNVGLFDPMNPNCVIWIGKFKCSVKYRDSYNVGKCER